jgi:[protein-PII] uridylyltransferase
MPTSPSLSSELRELSAKESARIKEQFAATGDGKAALLGRTALIESIIERLWKQHVFAESRGPADCAVVALGGFGRRWLFPFSDVDVLFLHAGNGTEEKSKEPVRKFSQDLWDLGLKLSPATRTLAECGKFEAANSEFAISLLDCRYLAGDHRVFARLHDDVIPKLLSRESDQIVKRLGELTRTRHGKFGSTVFHLEPNIKDGPGGLRDYNVVCWLSLLAAIEQYHVWPSDDAVLPVSIQEPFAAALNALVSIRCFLHFRHNRDDNTLTWESQDAAAAQKIGVAHSPRSMRAVNEGGADGLSTA